MTAVDRAIENARRRWLLRPTEVPSSDGYTNADVWEETNPE